MSAGGKGGVKNEINVTPLVDVCLVLLIIFMVVTPMLQRGKDVKLPTVTHKKAGAEEKQNPDLLIISVTSDKQIYVEKDHYDLGTLKDRISGALAKNPTQKILLKGDQTLQVGDVRKVMLAAQHASAKGVGLGVQEEKQK
jgi:biopolymer transport protein ExbD/biopolymer transport protein TolR